MISGFAIGNSCYEPVDRNLRTVLRDVESIVDYVFVFI